MKLRDGSVFVAELTTAGRRTGLPRTVELRFVYLDGKFYASSGRVENKHWCRNMLKNPAVELKVGKDLFSCRARLLKDEQLRLRVLSVRDSPPLADRVVFELTPNK
ncbi:MAG: nitroreductase/quinone reductase family protein [Candidatus Binatia bacterium]